MKMIYLPLNPVQLNRLLQSPNANLDHFSLLHINGKLSLVEFEFHVTYIM